MDTSQKERLLPSREDQSRKMFRVPTTYTTGIRTFLMRWSKASNYSKHGVAGCIFSYILLLMYVLSLILMRDQVKQKI